MAQLIPGWDTKQFTWEQLDAERIRLMREVEINGSGPNAGQQIFADELLWNRVSGEFEASGNVLLVSPTARLSAERVVFNTKTGLGGFLDVAALQGWKVFGTVAAAATPSANVAAIAHDTLKGKLVDRLRAAGELDGVLLHLHGAMLSENAPDAEKYKQTPGYKAGAKA